MNATALLMVLTLTGSPLATLTCISWCGSPASPASCHGTSDQALPVSIAEADATCAQLLAANPFVRENVRVKCDSARVSTVPALNIARPASADVPSVREARDTPPAFARTMSLVLRI